MVHLISIDILYMLLCDPVAEIRDNARELIKSISVKLKETLWKNLQHKIWVGF